MWTPNKKFGRNCDRKGLRRKARAKIQNRIGRIPASLGPV
jgi:hypothetical protein